MILVNQHFRECSFCGRKFPPHWEPLERNGRMYCSEKCVHFEASFPEAARAGGVDNSMANREAAHVGTTGR
jgi:hypothetical protein